MNRKACTLMSLGISVALIAAGIWFLYNHHTYMGYGDKGWVMPHHGMMGGGRMGVMMILFWMVLLTAVVLLISGLMSRHRLEDPGGKQEVNSDALNILKQRYASGQISKVEFEDMKQDLQ